MKAAIFALVIFGACSQLSADDTPAAGDAAEAQSLFDGKTLKNWTKTNFGGEGEVSVSDGAISMGMGNPMTGVTWNGPALPKSNYEVQFEARRKLGSDFFCALTFPVKDQFASLVLGGWGGAVTGISSVNGYDASENETTDFFKFEKDQWYKVRLKVTENKIEAWLDDEQFVDLDLEGKKFSVRIEVELSKPLGISTFETIGEIRKLTLRDLKAGEAAKDKPDAVTPSPGVTAPGL